MWSQILILKLLLNFFLQILNIGDVPSWMREEVCNEEDDDNDFTTRCILCMPIFNGQKTVIGVAQLINKVRIWILDFLGL